MGFIAVALNAGQKPETSEWANRFSFCFGLLSVLGRLEMASAHLVSLAQGKRLGVGVLGLIADVRASLQT